VLPSFPEGSSGLALLVLRNALAAMLFCMESDRGSLNPPWTLAIPVTILLACLCLGCFTSWVSVLCAAGSLFELILIPGFPADRALVASSISASVAQLGPGAYSVDSYRYGRHRRVFPATD
jgi:hypothetical protein